ncbi:hypothetical protein K439DRAFT_1629180 [Ramaria rubella]|nr:hypothetical protein K439DRAFT_1629180 [Ramaria rubella]
MLHHIAPHRTRVRLHHVLSSHTTRVQAMLLVALCLSSCTLALMSTRAGLPLILWHDPPLLHFRLVAVIGHADADSDADTYRHLSTFDIAGVAPTSSRSIWQTRSQAPQSDAAAAVAVTRRRLRDGTVEAG